MTTHSGWVYAMSESGDEAVEDSTGGLQAAEGVGDGGEKTSQAESWQQL